MDLTNICSLSAPPPSRCSLVSPSHTCSTGSSATTLSQPGLPLPQMQYCPPPPPPSATCSVWVASSPPQQFMQHSSPPPPQSTLPATHTTHLQSRQPSFLLCCWHSLGTLAPTQQPEQLGTGSWGSQVGAHGTQANPSWTACNPTVGQPWTTW